MMLPSLLTIIIAGMGKWGTAWPHLGHDRPSKDMDGVQNWVDSSFGAWLGRFLVWHFGEGENHGADAWLS